MSSSEQQERPATYHIVMLSFDGEEAAGRAVHRLRAQRALDGCEIGAEALISRDSTGRIHVHERGAAGIGATFGAATAGLVGILTGPIILPLLIVLGAVVGGVAGHFAGQILPPADLREVAESLPPNGSAYVVVVDAVHADALAGAFADEGARVLNLPVRSEMSSVIREAITGHLRRV